MINNITVNYDRTFDEMVYAGQYGAVDESINAKAFEIRGQGSIQLEVRLFHFFDWLKDNDIDTRTVLCEIKADQQKKPWSPARIEHLLAYGEMFPMEQEKYMIISLGSSGWVPGRTVVPVLDVGPSGRCLALMSSHIGWDLTDRFLAVRELSPSS